MELIALILLATPSIEQQGNKAEESLDHQCIPRVSSGASNKFTVYSVNKVVIAQANCLRQGNSCPTDLLEGAILFLAKIARH